MLENGLVDLDIGFFIRKGFKILVVLFWIRIKKKISEMEDWFRENN